MTTLTNKEGVPLREPTEDEKFMDKLASHVSAIFCHIGGEPYPGHEEAHSHWISTKIEEGVLISYRDPASDHPPKKKSWWRRA